MEWVMDCVIIGGGPAGSFAAKLLADYGLSALVVEKRACYSEKICGGFVPYKAIQILSHHGISRKALSAHCGHPILVTDTNQSGTREQIAYPEGKYGLGVYRQIFDRYLSDLAVQAGANILFSQPIALEQLQYDSKADSFRISMPGGVVTAKYLIIATGSMGLLPQKRSPEQAELLHRRTFGVSEIVRCTSSLPRDTLRFYCPSPDAHDYYWMIPLKQDAWNIGYWMERPDKTIKELFAKYKSELFTPFCGEQTVIYPLRGAYLGNVDLSNFYPKRAYVIGDAGGNNAQTTGEGIRFALESALEAVLDLISHTERGDVS